MRFSSTFALFLLAVLSCSCTPPEGPAKAAPATAPLVETIEVERRVETRTARVTGAVESLRDDVVSAEVSGRVVARPHTQGEVVEPGAAVVLLEEKPHRLQRDLARVAAEEAALHPDTPASTRAASDLELAIAQDRLDRCRIASPLAGTVERLHVETGEWVPAGAPVARVIDFEALRFFAELGEAEAVLVAPGTEVPFTVDAWGPEVFGARVVRVARAAEETSRRFRVELEIVKAPEKLALGMFARARIPLSSAREIISIPKKSVRESYGESRCFVAVRSGDSFTAKERSITVAAIPGDLARIEVRRGLEPGDVLIAGPLTGIRDGVVVRISGD